MNIHIFEKAPYGETIYFAIYALSTRRAGEAVDDAVHTDQPMGTSLNSAFGVCDLLLHRAQRYSKILLTQTIMLFLHRLETFGFILGLALCFYGCWLDNIKSTKIGLQCDKDT